MYANHALRHLKHALSGLEALKIRVVDPDPGVLVVDPDPGVLVGSGSAFHNLVGSGMKIEV